MWQHEEIAQKMLDDGGWFSIKDICSRYELNPSKAYSLVNRIQTCKTFNIRTKKVDRIKYVQVFAEGELTKKQALARSIMFGIKPG